MVLSGEIQKAALAYAASNGIGVAKFLPGNRIRWLQFLQGDVPREVERARFAEATLRSVTEPDHVSINRGFYAYDPDGEPFHGGFEEFLQAGFVEFLERAIWRSDLEGWHWRREYEA